MKIYLVMLIILVAGPSYGQVQSWTEKDVDRLYGDTDFNSLVDDWAEFYKLSSERARSKYENEGAEELSNEIRAFKDQLFIERPSIRSAEIHKEVKAFIENAPYAPDLLEREIRLSELVWTRITNKSLVSNLQLRFPMFTTDQIQNMISGKTRERRSDTIKKLIGKNPLSVIRYPLSVIGNRKPETGNRKPETGNLMPLRLTSYAPQATSPLPSHNLPFLYH